MSTRPKWFFREFDPGDTITDPDFAKALFASDGEAPLARSLIREALQNSLDAKRADAAEVLVRITVQHGVLTGAAGEFLDGGWPHLLADKAGLDRPPTRLAAMPFLILEDFGTHGLRGNPEHWQPIDIAKNSFYLFFRALGRSGKADEERGRWGVGKFVFPMSSRGHLIWGLTIPSDTAKPLLMGRAVLRTHTLTNGESFHPDGHWGHRHAVGSKFVSPVHDPGVIQRFVQAFSLRRRDEPGLSVVVPWVDEEIKVDDLRSAVLAEYFMPLLRGELVVELSNEVGREVLDADSVRRCSATAGPSLTRERLALGVAITDCKSAEFTWPTLFSYDDTQWNLDDVPSTFIDDLKRTLEAGTAISVTLRVAVRRKSAPTEAVLGQLVVHLRRSEGLGSVRPLLVRDGISVSEDKTKTLRDHVAILTADRCSLATLIGDAETPAHERLQHDLIKDKYTYPKKMISFVREAAANLLGALWRNDEGDDPFALASYFPLLSDDGRAAKRPRPTPRGPEPEPEPTRPSPAEAFQHSQDRRGVQSAGFT